MPDQTEEVAATMMTAVSASVKTPAATGIVTETAAGAIAADGGIAATLWTIKGVYGLVLGSTMPGVKWTRPLRPPLAIKVTKTGQIGSMIRYDTNDDYAKQKIIVRFPGSEKLFKMGRNQVEMHVVINVRGSICFNNHSSICRLMGK
jgi:hypothetical protein